MKLCLLGEYKGNLDEGARKISFYIARELSKDHDVITLDLRTAGTRAFWKSIKTFDPQIVHYIHGGSLKGFILLQLISLYCPHAKTCVSIMRFHPSSRYAMWLFKPDLILAQSGEVEKIFTRWGCRTLFLPCGGVDREKFRPVSIQTKSELREKYGIAKDKFVILHIGSVKRGRNIQLMERLRREENQVVIVGSTSTGIDNELYTQLKNSGCTIMTDYFENIDEIYALSDCYVFLVILKRDIIGRPIADCIDIPLSVLEAMSCNLPVVTTRFGALPDIFNDGEGFYYAKNERDVVTALNEIKKGITIQTRAKVLPYSWEKVVNKVEEVYSQLLAEENEN